MPKSAKDLARKRALRLFLLDAGQIATFACAGIAAFILRFDFTLPAEHLHHFLVAIPVWTTIKILTFHFAGLDRRGYRYVSMEDAFRLLLANVSGSAISVPIILVLSSSGFPRSVYFIDLIVCLTATTGTRLTVRLIAEFAQNGHGPKLEKRTLIYGAGDAGITLLREIRNNPRLAYKVCGFIDDQLVKEGVLINRVPVLGSGAEVKS